MATTTEILMLTARWPALLQVSMLFDVFAMFGMTAWAADDWQPRYGIIVALALAGVAAGATAGATAGVLCLLDVSLTRLAGLRAKSKPRVRLSASADGLDVCVPGSDEGRLIAWPDIAEIVAYKADLLTVDHIILLVRMRDATVFEFGEDVDGWSETTATLSDFLDCERFEEWFFAVAFPAFATNVRQIFPRPSASRTPSATTMVVQVEPEPSMAPVMESSSWSRFWRVLTSGVGGILLAVAALLAPIGIVQGRGALLRTASTILVYVLLTRFAFFAWCERTNSGV